MKHNYTSKRYIYSFVFFTLIVLIGSVMMILTSSPLMHGAAMLWIPAALQLIAGVWFGPILGLFIGGLGAYVAGIIAYGGWSGVGIIINLIAGGFANAWLPAILFKSLKINPSFNINKEFDDNFIWKFLIFIFIFSITFILGLSPLFYRYNLLSSNHIANIISIVLLIIFFSCIYVKVGFSLKLLLKGILAILLSNLTSSIIGSLGQIINEGTFTINDILTAYYKLGIGWFLGDTVSSFLGLIFLMFFTKEARSSGISIL